MMQHHKFTMNRAKYDANICKSFMYFLVSNKSFTNEMWSKEAAR